MKNKIRFSLWAAALLFVSLTFNGCVAIPPLINVEHKDTNAETNKKLDAIQRRLDALEQKIEHKN